MKVEVGSIAPDFELEDQNGLLIKLSDYKGKSNVVLYFYPKDETPGCTKQACAFRDLYHDFQESGAEVLGISSDSVASHKQFAQHHNLPFRLLSDCGGKARKAYGVPKKFFLIPGRETFVIDKSGRVIYKFNSLFEPIEHIQKALEALKSN